MANGSQAQKQALFDKLVAEGGDPKEAAEFAGIKAPKQAATSTETQATKAAEKATPDAKTRTISRPNIRTPKMNPSQAQKIIFGIMIGVTALMIFGDVISGKARAFDTIPRRMIGGSIAGIMLMLFAVPAPRLAVAFAAVAGAGSLFLTEGGKSVIDGLTRLTGGEPTTGSGSDFVPPPIVPGRPS